MELIKGRGGVGRPRKDERRCLADDDLGRRKDGTTLKEVASKHGARAVSERDVKVRCISAQCADEAADFKGAGALGSAARIRKAQRRVGEAADASRYVGRMEAR